MQIFPYEQLLISNFTLPAGVERMTVEVTLHIHSIINSNALLVFVMDKLTLYTSLLVFFPD